MPEIKHNFTGGKMNKDFDERLIPNGQYRDAMNIQVSTSEDSEVGTIQNILGNEIVPINIANANNSLPQGSKCIGSVSDEKNNTLYWLISGPPLTGDFFNLPDLHTTYNYILSYDGQTTKFVFVDQKSLLVNMTATFSPNPNNGKIPVSAQASLAVNPGDKVSYLLDENGVIYDGGIITAVDRVGPNYSVTLDIFNPNSPLGNISPFPSYLILVFENSALKFDQNNLITGINVIDEMLFWTDNSTEPKKINIPRSIQGTHQSGIERTVLINEDRGINESTNVTPVQEEHITVIRKSPKNPLLLEFNTGRDPDLTYSAITEVGVDPSLSSGINTSNITGSSNATVIYDFSTLQIGDTVRFELTGDIYGNQTFALEWGVGDIIALQEFNANGTVPGVPLSGYTIRGAITDWELNRFSQDPGLSGAPAQIEIEVVALNGTPQQPLPPAMTLGFVVDLQNPSEKLFKLKLPRFSYRYKYEDGEYSTFAPFSDIAFVPGSFDYHPKEGFNLGMVNGLESLKLKDFITDDMPKDVVSIEILYKEDVSPNIYLVDTINQKDQFKEYTVDGNQVSSNEWNRNEYILTNDTIKGAIPSNQLARHWDNVPRKALAQDIVGSRIVYANYIQNYNLTSNEDNFKPRFKNSLKSWEETETLTKKSIKSLREYQLGVVFTDEYGRETPVLTSNDGHFKVDKRQSIHGNRLQVGLNGLRPDNFEYLKFFIKETSSEYYNLAMDRWYDAEDGNIWLAFPSTERNKIDIDTQLILKKGIDIHTTLENNKVYNVLAIENEAPDFIKTHRLQLGSRVHDLTIPQRIFGKDNAEMANTPNVGGVTFAVDYVDGKFKDSSLSELHKITEEMTVRFISPYDSSAEYKISEITVDSDANPPATPITKYYISIQDPFENDIDFIFDNALSPSKIRDEIKVQFIKHKVVDSPKFDGRFFVKIINDGNIKEDIQDDSLSFIHDEVVSKMVYLMRSDNYLRDLHSSAAISASGINYISGTGYPGGIGMPSNIANSRRLWARSAYFGKLTSQIAMEPLGLIPTGTTIQLPNTVVDMDGPSPVDTIKYDSEGVWFIDKSTRKYLNKHGDSFKWEKCDPMSRFDFDPGDQPGIVNDMQIPSRNNGEPFSEITLGFGGIEYPDGFNSRSNRMYQSTLSANNEGKFHWSGGSDEECEYTYYMKKLTNFFTIGQGTNQNYNDPFTADFVGRINSGFKFKWEDDPTGTVYRIFDGYNTKQHARWDDNDSGHVNTHSYYGSTSQVDLAYIAQPSSYHKSWDFMVSPSMSVWDPTANWGGPIANGLEIGATVYSQSCTTTSGSNIIVPAAPNANIKIGMTVYGTGITHPPKTVVTDILANGDIEISSNATTGATNALEFGYTIRAVQTKTITISTVSIEVDNIIAECDVYGSRFSLKKGMLLAEYDDGNDTPNSGVSSNSNIIIKDITPGVDKWTIEFTGFTNELQATDFPGAFTTGGKMLFKQASMNSLSDKSEHNINEISKPGWAANEAGMGAVGYKLWMLDEIDEWQTGSKIPISPYIWETEPKEDVDLDIYYEISGNNPLELNHNTINTAIPIGSHVRQKSPPIGNIAYTAVVTSNLSSTGDVITTSTSWDELDPVTGSTIFSLTDSQIAQGLNTLIIQRPDGTEITASMTAADGYTIKLNKNLYNSWYLLNWHNCFSFGNGVESNRIRDSFNKPFIRTGVKASSILKDKEYKEEHRKYGLIYSGIYNSTSGLNNLNQFTIGEKITKDLNPTYGSIQKIHTRDTDLITLCEDKILKISADKDAVFNADGNPQLIATDKVLGQTMPFTGEFGISQNPESFASESYRLYFTDRARGAVMRLSKDGLTPISNHGMKDWFRDNLKYNTQNTLIGSYDDRNDEYNITLKTETDFATVSFREDVRGWVSFKSFIPENAISCNNIYYTFKDGDAWAHDSENITRNTFYGDYTNSSFNVLLNDLPSVVKSYNTLEYEGSQSKVDLYAIDPVTGLSNADHYNLEEKKGWYVESIKTDKEDGRLNEFIEKEGKWYNYIRGKNVEVHPNDLVLPETFDTSSFAIQGLGIGGNPTMLGLGGCMDSTAWNYNTSATFDDGSCIYAVSGCMAITADNYQWVPNLLIEDGSCVWNGCTDVNDSCYTNFPNEAVQYNTDYPGAIVDDGSCCGFLIYGCTDSNAINYFGGTTNDDGSCIYQGCTDPLALNTSYFTHPNPGTLYTNPIIAVIDDGSCNYTAVPGCTDPQALNFNQNCAGANVTATVDDGCCQYAPPPVQGCTDNTTIDGCGLGCNGALNYDPLATVDDGSCTYCVYGCMDPNYLEFDSNATCNQPADCVTPIVYGCTDPPACNYNQYANVDDGSCYYGTSGTWDCVSSGPPSFNVSCQPVPCGLTPGPYNSLPACQANCGNA